MRPILTLAPCLGDKILDTSKVALVVPGGQTSNWVVLHLKELYEIKGKLVRF
jgi:hypothetical protein